MKTMLGALILVLVIGISGQASPQQTGRSSKSGQESPSRKVMSFVFLASYNVSITKKIDYGDTPVGKRVDVHFEGDLTGDLLSGTMRGIDYVTIRSDGVTEINPRASLKTSDGALISVQISGYAFPDGTIKDTFVRFLTSDEKYKWLNEKVIFGEGRMTSETEFEIKYYYEP